MTDRVLEAKPILERFSLSGRTALVTGGGQGIGRAYAHALGEAGAAVAVVDIVRERAETVGAELRAKNIDALVIEADVTKPDSVNAMVATLMQTWGKLTIGVNNAGIGQWVNSEEMSEADWDRMMDVNMKGVFLCSQAECRVMAKAGSGKIINTASMSGSIVNTPQNQAAYNASKAGVVHLTRSLAAEWAPKGIRVNSISPGYTASEMVYELLDRTPGGKDILARWMSLTPMGCMGYTTDYQGLVVYLASEVSDFMTGSDLVIDGGYCTW